MTTTLEPVSSGKATGVLIRFPAVNVRSRVLSFPTYFEMEARRPLAVKPFHVLDGRNQPQTISVPNLLYRDTEDETGLVVPIFNEEELSP